MGIIDLSQNTNGLHLGALMVEGNATLRITPHTLAPR